MNSIDIDAGTGVATVGAGVQNYEIIDALFAAKKRTGKKLHPSRPSCCSLLWDH